MFLLTRMLLTIVLVLTVSTVDAAMVDTKTAYPDTVAAKLETLPAPRIIEIFIQFLYDNNFVAPELGAKLSEEVFVQVFTKTKYHLNTYEFNNHIRSRLTHILAHHGFVQGIKILRHRLRLSMTVADCPCCGVLTILHAAAKLCTCVHCAWLMKRKDLETEQVDTLKELLDANVPIDGVMKQTGHTALHLAVQYQRQRAKEYLISRDAKRDIPDSKGMSVDQMLAAQSGVSIASPTATAAGLPTSTNSMGALK